MAYLVVDSEYMAFPCLWNPQDPNYRSVTYRKYCMYQVLDKINAKNPNKQQNISDIKRYLVSLTRQRQRVIKRRECPPCSTSLEDPLQKEKAPSSETSQNVTLQHTSSVTIGTQTINLRESSNSDLKMSHDKIDESNSHCVSCAASLSPPPAKMMRPEPKTNIIDETSSDLSPRRKMMAKELLEQTKLVISQKETIKALRSENWRLQNRNAELSKELENLKNKNLINNETADASTIEELENNFFNDQQTAGEGVEIKQETADSSD